MKASTSRKLIFAGGGTAGHVEPALAVAREWMREHPSDQCIFLGTPSGLENSLVPSAGFDLQNISKVAMPRSISFELFLLPSRLAHSVKSARKIIKESDVLIGFGGYLAASAYLAARLEKIPIVIHEANATVGWANRLGAVFTKYLAIAHPISSGRFARALVTGLPLRADVKRAFHDASTNWEQARLDAKRKLEWDVDRPTILILGGSQGSTFINTQITLALPELTSRGIQILHSVGAKNALPTSSTNYKAVPYISDMATAYLAADVIIARSGAVTCAEVGALGRSAIFIPLPVGNGEQARNADYLVAEGRAIVISQGDFTASWLVSNIDLALQRSAQISISGINNDIDAEKRIVELMKRAMALPRDGKGA